MEKKHTGEKNWEVLRLSYGKVMGCMSGLLWEPVTDVLHGFGYLATLSPLPTFTFDLKITLNKTSVHSVK